MKMLRTRFTSFLLPLLLFSINAIVSERAESIPCFCPTTDVMNQPQCGPKPALVDDHLYENKMCMIPTAAAPSSFRSVFTPMAMAQPDKNPEELLDYMSCYRGQEKDNYNYHAKKSEACSPKNARACGADQRFCHFKKTMGPLVSLSAQASHLPYAVQACLYNRESDYMPTAGSAVGAKGYIQFMPKTEAIVNEVIHGSFTKWEAQIREADREIADRSNKLAKTTNKRERAKLIAAINNWKMLRGYAKGPMKARKAWDRFWKGTKNPPQSVSFKDVSCPNLAIAMGMVKQLYDMFVIKKSDVTQHEDGTLTIGKMDAMDSAIFLDGAYNVGIGTFASMCGGYDKLQPCIDHFKTKKVKRGHKRNTETPNHMISIRNCAKKNSDAPMTGNDKVDCTEKKCTAL